MSCSERIGQIFSRLTHTGSLADALAHGVRQACEMCGCAAGAVVTDPDADGAAGSGWFRHDPQGWFDWMAGDRTTLAGLPSARNGGNAAAGLNDHLPHKVQVPLYCAGREVGRLILLAPVEASPDMLTNRLAALATALAVLLAAVENSAAKPLAGVLGRAAFRARVASELARSERSGDALSVLHVKVASSQQYKGDDIRGPWTQAAVLGEALAARLRKSDVVGLMGPDRLAVLLTATGGLGARIAARRILQLLRELTSRPSRSEAAGEEPLVCLRVFPGDGGDAEKLCEMQEWTSEAMAPSGARITTE